MTAMAPVGEVSQNAEVLSVAFEAIYSAIVRLRHEFCIGVSECSLAGMAKWGMSYVVRKTGCLNEVRVRAIATVLKRQHLGHAASNLGHLQAVSQTRVITAQLVSGNYLRLAGKSRESTRV